MQIIILKIIVEWVYLLLSLLLVFDIIITFIITSDYLGHQKNCDFKIKERFGLQQRPISSGFTSSQARKSHLW